MRCDIEHTQILADTTRCPRTQKRNRGAAVVELAVCLPVVVLLIFASLEGANMLFVRQAGVQASYEAVKAAARINGSQADGILLAEQVLDARNINTRTIEFNPNNVDALPEGTPFTVTVRIPGDSRSVTGFAPFRGINIEVQATMLKE